jgi:hypothetical protein
MFSFLNCTFLSTFAFFRDPKFSIFLLKLLDAYEALNLIELFSGELLDFFNLNVGALLFS